MPSFFIYGSPTEPRTFKEDKSYVSSIQFFLLKALIAVGAL
jgi:hypothetical protein